MTTRLLGLLLRLYPSDFRRRFGPEMVERAEAMLEAAHSPAARTIRSIRILVDATVSVPRAWRSPTSAARGVRVSLPSRIGADLGSAARALRARPGLSFTVVGTLALSIGVTTSLFSVVNGVLLRPLPYENPEELVSVYQTNNAWMDDPSPMLRRFATRLPLSYPILEGWRAQQNTLDDLAGYTEGSFLHLSGGEATILEGLWTTSNLLPLLGVEPVLGRLPAPAHDRPGAQPVVVLGHRLWSERFSADPDILERSIALGGVPYPIIAVAPRGFEFAGPFDERADLWITFDDELKSRPDDAQFLASIARLKNGVPLEAARADLEVIQDRIQATFAEPVPEDARDVNLFPLLDEVVGEVRRTLLVLLSAVALVLLIACGNIANLLLVSGLGRRRELAVRSALGATPTRLVRSRLAEIAVMTVAGGVFGAMIAWGLHGPLLDLLPPDVPRADAIRLDGRVFAFAATVTFGTTLLVGLLPAVFAGRTDPGAEMRDGGVRGGLSRGVSRLRAGVVVVEIALSVVLLVSAGLLGASYWRMQRVELGFEPEHLVALSLELPEADLGLPADVFTAELDRRLREIPGVTGVALTNDVPLGGGLASGTVYLDRPDGSEIDFDVEMSTASPDFFDVMGIDLVAGRAFDARDGPGTRRTIVNRTAAELLWPGRNPIGLPLRRGRSAPGEPPPTYYEVVGVVNDVRHVDMTRPPQPRMYRSALAHPSRTQDWVVRAEGELGSVVRAARDAVWATDPGLPVESARPVRDLVRRTTAQPRFRALLIGTLALLAGLLATLGVGGVVGFAVSQRTREIGVRIALGANRGRVVRSFVARGLGMALVGAAVGVAIAFPVARLLSEFLFGVGARDPGTFGAVAAGVIVVACLAAWWPARRASRVDPVRVLSAE